MRKIIMRTVKMSGLTFGKTEEEIADALGEVTNMVMGSIKTQLGELQHIQLSIPTVIAGRSLRSNLGEWTIRANKGVQAAGQHLIKIAMHSRENNKCE